MKNITRLKKLISKPKSLLLAIKRRRAFGKRGAYRRLPIEEKTVLFDAFSGLGVLDSPRAIFKRMLEREEFKDFKFIWAVNNRKLSEKNLEEFESLKNVRFVRRNSDSYYKYLLVSKYIVCNSSFPKTFAKRPEQVYLNTWHGVPLKVMGYERPGQRVASTQRIMQNFLNADYILGANTFTAERMFKKAYMLDGIYEGKLLSAALPRTDNIYNVSREEARKRLADAGFKTDKKIIVYAPTWKGALYNSLKYDLGELKGAVNELKSKINTDEYEVYLRVHYFIYRAIMMDEEMRRICLPFSIDTDELLPAVDILISDYSSIFFDFLGTGRPIFFYVPDLADYSENRGIYFPMEDMPGPVSETIDGIAKNINDLEAKAAEYSEKYNKMREWCCEWENGRAADSVIDAVFLNKPSEFISCKTDKKRLMIMADFEKRFKAQDELIEFFGRIDYEKYDVTLLSGKPEAAEQLNILENIDSRVRILVNDKIMNVKSGMGRRVEKGLSQGKLPIKRAIERLNISAEWRRLTSGVKFDELIFVQPSKSPVNWMLFGAFAPIESKSFIGSAFGSDSIFAGAQHLENYSKVYASTQEYEADQK